MERQITVERKLRNGSIQQLSTNAVVCKLSKLFLNKKIKWSSSRYEVMKKKDVINEIIKGFENGFIINKSWDGMGWVENKITFGYFHSGSYCESGSLSRHGTYYIDYKNRYFIDIDDTDSGEITKIYSAYLFN